MQINSQKIHELSFKNIKKIFLGALKGKSLSRILQNIALEQVSLQGSGVDLGSKSNKSSYYKSIQLKEGVNILFTDLYPQNDKVVKLDLEKDFPFENSSKDFLLLINVLEHLFKYQNCIQESFRVLKKQGYLIGIVPFLHQVHLDPDDFFRYTQSSLRRLFEEVGFTDIQIAPLGFGPFSSGFAQTAMQFANVKILRPLIAICFLNTIILDKILDLFFKKKQGSLSRTERYPLTYFFVCKK